MWIVVVYLFRGFMSTRYCCHVYLCRWIHVDSVLLLCVFM